VFIKLKSGKYPFSCYALYAQKGTRSELFHVEYFMFLGGACMISAMFLDVVGAEINFILIY
jgi:hypothetical protein